MLTLSEKTIGEKLGGLDDIDSSGQECSFIDMKNGWGIKCYNDKGQADTNYICQKYVASLGMAPKVGKRFTITDPVYGDKYYCHLTEVVELCAPYGIKNRFAEEEEYEDEEFEDPVSVAPYYDERMEWVQNFYDKTGYEYWDTHTGNFGFLRGILVCIDFDNCHDLAKEIKGKK